MSSTRDKAGAPPQTPSGEARYRVTGGEPPPRLSSYFLRRARPEAVIDRAYSAWVRSDECVDLAYWRLASAPLAPVFSVIMPVRDTEAAWLSAAIASVRAQVYPHWQLCVVDDASGAVHVAGALAAAAAADSRIRVERLAVRAGISGASNAALGLATGEFVTFLDHDDLLAPHALAVMAVEIAAYPHVDLLFSDEDQWVEGRRRRPYFKPGWNPDLLLGQNSLGHLAVYRTAVVRRLGGLRSAFDGAQDFDLSLRATQDLARAAIRHVPHVLYHWRQSGGSVSAASAEACARAARAALAEVTGSEVVVAADVPQWSWVRRRARSTPLVSVVGRGAEPAVRGAEYPGVEVVGLGDARGEVLLFLSGALRGVAEGWLEELVALACLAGVGAVGGRLTGVDGRILHAGYVLDPVTIVEECAARADAGDPGYRGHYRLRRTVAAVSGDCLAVRREVFEGVGGLDLAMGEFADVDLCLRLMKEGLRTVWTPAAWLGYATSSHERVGTGAAAMQARWGAVLANDPYLNRNLGWHAGRVSLKKPVRGGSPRRGPGAEPLAFNTAGDQ